MKIDGDFNNPMSINSQISLQNVNNAETTVRKDVNGKTVVGVMLPDYLKENLDIVVVIYSKFIKQHFRLALILVWDPAISVTIMLEQEIISVGLVEYLTLTSGTCLYESRLVPVPVDFKDDANVLKYGIGFTNICTRSAKGTSDLSRKDVKEGSVAMLEKIRCYKPKIAVFNGKGKPILTKLTS